MILEKILIWQKRRKKTKFSKLLAEQLKPTWLFDKGNYVWFLHGRKIVVIKDQVGNTIVYDDHKMVSPLLKSKEEGQAHAINYVVNEIANKYYPKFNE